MAAYPITGFFFDCIYTPPCVGLECLQKMEEQGLDWTDPDQLHRFNWEKHLEMSRRLADAARSVNPDLLFYYNGVDYEAQQDIGNYLEFECLPTGGWGYEELPMGASYQRTLGKPVLNMTGRFNKSWGDFGGIRTGPPGYDCLYGMANAIRTTIRDASSGATSTNRSLTCNSASTPPTALQPWLEGAEASSGRRRLAHPYPGYQFRAPMMTALLQLLVFDQGGWMLSN